MVYYKTCIGFMGGERLLARLAGVKYLDESGEIVEGFLDIAEDAGRSGARINREAGNVGTIRALV
jgi:hypothetical protein